MSSLCTRCALRLQRTSESARNLTSKSKRAFSSSTSTRSKGALPSFAPTSNPELDASLSSFRYKHFLPAALSKQEQKLIFKHTNEALLAENPQTVTLGNEDIQLEWIDRKMGGIPNRRKLLSKTVQLMVEGEKTDWNNLPALLAGLHKAKRTPTDRQMAKMVRLAANDGRFGTVLQCLHQAHNTGMTMKGDEVLNAVIWALREIAQNGEWSERSLAKAIRDANEVAMQLEDVEHGTGKHLRPGDPRRRPEVLGVFLELAAVYAWRFQDGKDVDGKVKAYSERLLANIEGAERPASTTPAETGPQVEMRRGGPILHGLRVAQKVLGDDMPKAALAEQVIKEWDAGLATLAKTLKDKKWTKPGRYGGQALQVWKECGED